MNSRFHHSTGESQDNRRNHRQGLVQAMVEEATLRKAATSTTVAMEVSTTITTVAVAAALVATTTTATSVEVAVIGKRRVAATSRDRPPSQALGLVTTSSPTTISMARGGEMGQTSHSLTLIQLIDITIMATKLHMSIKVFYRQNNHSTHNWN